MKRILSLITCFALILSCSKDTVTPTPTPEPTPKYALVIAASEGGTVSTSGGTYDKGTKVTVTATPDGEYLFDSWSDGSTENPRDITVTSNLDLTANFVKKKYSLSISTSGEGTVTEEVLVQGSVSNYNSGTKVRLTAVPNSEENWEFIGWTGDIESTDLVIEIDVTEAKSVEAKFMRYFNYMVPSHDWENYYQPYIDYYNIVLSSLNNVYSLTHSNTYYGVGDFNGDGYVDINTGIPQDDDVPIEYLFLINDGNETYSLDNTFPYTQNNNVLSPRKTIVGDFNGDNKPDVFRPAGAHDNLSKPNLVLSRESSYEHVVIENAPLSQPHTVCSGDIDNDGDLDVFVSQAGENDGFLINNGDATFEWRWISEVITDFDKGHIYPNGGFGYYGFWSSEMTDVDKDGYVDLILGGSYRDQSYDAAFDGPTILWGSGTGNYKMGNSTTLFNWKELDYDGDRLISLSHDYAVNDVDGDGLNDMVVLSELSGPKIIHFLKGKGERQFEDKTTEWVPEPFISEDIKTVVWVKLLDVDGNGNMDIVEGEPNIFTHQGEIRPSLRWEWNGNGFTKIN